MTRDQVGKALALLRGAWPEQPIGQDTVTAYHIALKDVPLAVGEQAAQDCIVSSRFFPKPAELREKALALLPPSVKRPYQPTSRRYLGVCTRCERAAEAIISGKRLCGDHADEALEAMGIPIDEQPTEAMA